VTDTTRLDETIVELENHMMPPSLGAASFAVEKLKSYRALLPLIEKLIEARDRATQGEWELWEGSSWRRFGIKHHQHERPFIYPYNAQHDNHPDISISTHDANFIATAANIASQLKEIINDR